MKVVLATGIYPPEIGGPATYAHHLARELQKRGITVTVITYAHRKSQDPNPKPQTISQPSPRLRPAGNCQLPISNEGWSVIYVAKFGGSLLRWWRYAKVLRQHAADADVIIAFSSVSVGVPLALARLRKPKKILRLGGDFFWERYTDRGGMKGLREWYAHRSLTNRLLRYCATTLLRSFDHIVFSTQFQEKLYEQHYRYLPSHSVIENAIPEQIYQFTSELVRQSGERRKHDPFRLLFMGRFVGFKNLPALLHAVVALRAIPLHLTFVGDGPLLSSLKAQVSRLHIPVTFRPPVHGAEKQEIFAEHDLLILPSKTEISPNVALEARAAGLPVLLTRETGLSDALAHGMILRDLSTAPEIVAAMKEVVEGYEVYADAAVSAPPKRGWNDIAEEFLSIVR